MLRVRILCVGKLKEPFFRQAVAEYTKRLSRYVQLTVDELPDEPGSDTMSPAQVQQLLDREGERILAKLSPRDFVVILTPEGKKMDSPQLARALEDWTAESGQVTFIIGGSWGMSGAVKARAQRKLSFSDFTLCHQLFRVVWLEQLYRACKISRGETYHK